MYYDPGRDHSVLGYFPSRFVIQMGFLPRLLSSCNVTSYLGFEAFVFVLCRSCTVFWWRHSFKSHQMVFVTVEHLFGLNITTHEWLASDKQSNLQNSSPHCYHELLFIKNLSSIWPWLWPIETVNSQSRTSTDSNENQYNRPIIPLHTHVSV